LGRTLGEPQSRSGRGNEKNSQPLPGLEPPIIQPVGQRYTTEITRLPIIIIIITTTTIIIIIIIIIWSY
jgi:hypothetical protein